MISALNQKQMVFEALKNGAKHYIIKPIDPDKVIGIVNEVLDENTDTNDNEKNESKENKPGFEVENLNGKFIITFNEYLSIKDHISLETAVKGLLFVKPLNVVFDFDNLNEITEDTLHPIVRIGTTIVKSGGNLEYKAKNEKIAALLEEIK
jgi:response regulator RpfG family c-di-GMP phosphodiesterase